MGPKSSATFFCCVKELLHAGENSRHFLGCSSPAPRGAFIINLSMQVCPLNRQSVNDYASSQCQGWSSLLNGLVLGEGRQVKHQPVKGNWLACAVFCKTASGGQWYAPKKELEAINIDPYFPDGVWCHTDHQTQTNYYCQNHLCLPEQKP